MAIESPQPVKDPDYHFQESSLTPPVFFGKGAERLGIAGIAADSELGKQIYMNLFQGYATGEDGERGQKLVKYMHPLRRGAFQLIATNPKEVSTLNLVGGDKRIDDVIHDARAALARYVEQNAEVKVAKKAEIAATSEKYRKPDNLVMVWWDHTANRSNDPHRHGHLIAFNISHDAREGIGKGLEFYDFDNVKAAEIYRETMRTGLHQLGYKTKRVGNEYEITGFPAEVKGKYSGRSTSIDDRAAQFEQKKGKPLTPEGKRKFGLYDRPDKSPDMPLAARVKEWVSRLTRRQFGQLLDVVEKARFGYSRTRARAAYKAHVANRIDLAMVPETATHGIERSRNDGGPEREGMAPIR